MQTLEILTFYFVKEKALIMVMKAKRLCYFLCLCVHNDAIPGGKKNKRRARLEVPLEDFWPRWQMVTCAVGKRYRLERFLLVFQGDCCNILYSMLCVLNRR